MRIVTENRMTTTLPAPQRRPMLRPMLRPLLRPLAAALALAAAGLAQADGPRLAPASLPKAYIQECASCHTAYVPGLLPAASWQRLMSGLDHHFGSDAALDPATLQQLSQWLQANAASGKRSAAPPQDRISRADWFVREHRKIDEQVWRLPSVRSASNCTACHSAADQGRFSEHELRLPAGLDARQARAWND